MDHFDADLGRVPPDICPGCDQQFANVVSHWRQAASCSEPYLQPHQHQVLAGLLLVGGGLSSESGTNPHFQMESTDRALLEWVADQLGVFAGTVRETSRDPTATGLDSLSESTEAGDFNTLHKLSTKKLRQLVPYESAWYDGDGERCVPSGIDPTPTMLRTAYAVAGGIYDHTGRAYVRLTATDPSQSTIDRLFQGFAPRREERSTSVRVDLYNTTAFLETISPAVDCVADKWPSDVDEPERICPTCNGRFEALGQHWTKNTRHARPSIPVALREVVDGALLAGAHLKTSDGREAHLCLASTSRPYLEWAADQFEWLSCGISTLETADDAGDTLTASFGHPVDDASAVYQLTTASHPLFTRLNDRLDADPETVYGEIDRTPLTLAFLAGRHGWRRNDGSAFAINRARVPAPDSVLSDLLAPWDPDCYESNRLRQVRLDAAEADELLDYLGDELPDALMKEMRSPTASGP